MKLPIDKKRVALDIVSIFLGALALALSVNVFLTPNKISPGGVTSIGTVLLHLFGVRMSLTNLVINGVLFVFGYRYLGKSAVIKSGLGILFLSLCLELTSYLPSYGEDIMIATLIGGAVMGFGIGLVVRPGASTGGSDFASLIIKRFLPHVPVATIIMVIDCTIAIVAGLVFRSFTVAFYSIVCLVVSSKMTDAVVSWGDSARSVHIFSDKVEDIARYILEDFDRGVTGVCCRGMYSGKDRLMLLCVVTPKELPFLVRRVRQVDRGAFIVVNKATEVLGEGFKLETSYDDIQLKPTKRE